MPETPETQARPILVTGAAGFVGAALCKHFARKGRRVVAVYQPGHTPWRENSRVQSVDIDLTAAASVTAALDELRPSAILNCAAYGAYSQQQDSARIYQVNFEAVRTLVDAAGKLGDCIFVQAGSSSEYGTNCTAPREDGLTVPDSHYAVSKVAATAYVQFAGKKLNLPAWCLRLYSVYGPYEDASRLVPRLLGKGLAGGYPSLVDPSISRDFVYLDDVCDAFEAVLQKASSIPRGEVFNVGSGTKTTLRDIVATVQKLFSIKPDPVWGSMPDRHWDHADWYSNSQKAAEILGWRATTTLAEGLAATARWMRENPGALRAAEANVVTGGAA